MQVKITDKELLHKFYDLLIRSKGHVDAHIEINGCYSKEVEKLSNEIDKHLTIYDERFI